MILFVRYFINFELIRCYERSTYNSCEIFSLCGSKIEQHFFQLQTSCTDIIHNHQTTDIFICFGCFYVSAHLVDNDGKLQLKIEFFKMVGHTPDISRPSNAMMIGEVKNGILVKLRNHLCAAV